ncbi:MAG: hypothetical protein COV44_04000 [Deltaproteobacteria bacterium CG11_big_fil_rev_8_21_14_0_20_45_16]|nr:MAG: hypothetical protein COV44_04000 [Deltaproteobacteria bacterium CG11_big_fil_rev_8_21_14_0_20_45_16]
MSAKSKLWIFLGLVIFLSGLCFRLIPHTANFSPMIAFAIILAWYFRKNYLGVVLASFIWILSDWYLGFYAGWELNFLALLSCLGLSRYFLSFGSWTRVVGVGFAASLSFFVISNFGVWYSSGLYARSLEGLFECYTMALPFFRNSLTSTLFFLSSFAWVYQTLRALTPSTRINGV